MTNYHKRSHLTKCDKTVQRRLQRQRSACIPVVNHALAHCRKFLMYMMLEENTLFNAAAVLSAESPQWTTKPCLLEAILFYWLLETCTQQIT